MGACVSVKVEKKESSLCMMARNVRTVTSEADKANVIAVLKEVKDKAEIRYAKTASEPIVSKPKLEQDMSALVEATRHWRNAQDIRVVSVRKVRPPKRSLPA